MPAVNTVIDYRAANIDVKNTIYSGYMKIKRQKSLWLASTSAEETFLFTLNEPYPENCIISEKSY